MVVLFCFNIISITQYNTSNIKWSNSGIKSGTKVTLYLSSNVTGDFNDETNFWHKSLLTDKQVSRLPKAFTKGSSFNMKL